MQQSDRIYVSPPVIGRNSVPLRQRTGTRKVLLMYIKPVNSDLFNWPISRITDYNWSTIRIPATIITIFTTIQRDSFWQMHVLIVMFWLSVITWSISCEHGRIKTAVSLIYFIKVEYMCLRIRPRPVGMDYTLDWIVSRTLDWHTFYSNQCHQTSVRDMNSTDWRVYQLQLLVYERKLCV